MEDNAKVRKSGEDFQRTNSNFPALISLLRTQSVLEAVFDGLSVDSEGTCGVEEFYGEFKKYLDKKVRVNLKLGEKLLIIRLNCVKLVNLPTFTGS